MDREIIIFIKSKILDPCRRIRGYDIANINNFKIVNNLNFKNKICIFIREYINTVDFIKLKQNNNILILDIMDSSQKCLKQTYFDAFIINNKLMKNYFNKPTILIYHPIDLKCNQIKINKSNNIKIYYCGSPDKTYYFKDFKNLDIIHITFKDLEEKGFDGKIMFSCRKGYISSGDYYKVPKEWETSTKLATCVHFNNIFVTSKSPTVLELLGNDYPYYIPDNNLEQVKSLIELCKNDINEKNNRYKTAIAKIKSLKRFLSIENISKEYFNFKNILIK